MSERCTACSGTGQVLSITREWRPCSRCRAQDFHAWAEARRPAPDADPGFLNAVATTLRDGIKLKQKMLAKGISSAWTVCPECGGKLQGRLVGRRKHMRLWCEGECKRSMME